MFNSGLKAAECVVTPLGVSYYRILVNNSRRASEISFSV